MGDRAATGFYMLLANVLESFEERIKAVTYAFTRILFVDGNQPWLPRNARSNARLFLRIRRPFFHFFERHKTLLFDTHGNRGHASHDRDFAGLCRLRTAEGPHSAP